MKRDPRKGRIRAGGAAAALYEVLQYLHDNIRKPLSVADIADAFGYSKWYFSEKFRRLTGRTVTKYIRRYRIQLAALDILSGKKVLDTALYVGYDSVGGFNKAFFNGIRLLSPGIPQTRQGKYAVL